MTQELQLPFGVPRTLEDRLPKMDQLAHRLELKLMSDVLDGRSRLLRERARQNLVSRLDVRVP